MTEYPPVKSIWTELDFEQMSWHDNPIRGIEFCDNFEIRFDIDYIFEWVIKEGEYNFWISPCTLVFENAYNVDFDVEASSTRLTIDVITKENPQRPRNAEHIKREIEYDWTIEMQEGIIQFKSVGFKQYVRQPPKLLATQRIEGNQRNGVSFDIP